VITRTPFALWSLSASAGVIAAFAVFTFGARGLLALVALLVFAARLPQRSVAIAGLLVGFGGTAAFAFVSANSRCATAGEGQAVCAAGATPGTLVAIMVLLAGAALTAIPVLSSSAHRRL
jgi:hypothetical protein